MFRDLPVMFSLLFFFAFIIYFFIAVFILDKNHKAPLNWSFCAACIAMSVWTFSFAMSNNAESYEQCLFWRRVAAVGWVSVHSILLHSLLIMTKITRLIKKWWFLILFYLPAAFNIYVFSLSNKLAVEQYDLVRTDFGWINDAVNNIWDYQFYVYYILYILVSLTVIWVWKRKSSDAKVRRQSAWLLLAVLLSLLLGTYTDVYLSSREGSNLPQIASIFVLIPIILLFHMIRFDTVTVKQEKNVDEQILSNSSRNKLFNYFSMSIIVIGLNSLLINLMNLGQAGGVSMPVAVLSDGALILIGILIRTYQWFKTEKIINVLSSLTMLLSIPVVSLRYIETAALSAWVYPILLIMLALVFSRKIFLIAITITAVFTQVFMYSYMPTNIFVINARDFQLRIGFFILLFLIGLFVNKTYIAKLAENNRQIAFQKLVSDISSDFVGSRNGSLSEIINATLVRTGDFFNVDRTFIHLFDDRISMMSQAFFNSSNGASDDERFKNDLPVSDFQCFTDKLLEKEITYVDDVFLLPAESAGVQEYCRCRNIRSFTLIPIEYDGAVLGIFGLESADPRNFRLEYPAEVLKTIANLLADGIARIKAEN